MAIEDSMLEKMLARAEKGVDDPKKAEEMAYRALFAHEERLDSNKRGDLNDEKMWKKTAEEDEGIGAFYFEEQKRAQRLINAELKQAIKDAEAKEEDLNSQLHMGEKSKTLGLARTSARALRLEKKVRKEKGNWDESE